MLIHGKHILRYPLHKVLILMSFLILTLIGCSASATTPLSGELTGIASGIGSVLEKRQALRDRFTSVTDNSSPGTFGVMVDKETNICYLYLLSRSPYGSSVALTPLLGADGNLTYAKYE